MGMGILPLTIYVWRYTLILTYFQYLVDFSMGIDLVYDPIDPLIHNTSHTYQKTCPVPGICHCLSIAPLPRSKKLHVVNNR